MEAATACVIPNDAIADVDLAVHIDIVGISHHAGGIPRIAEPEIAHLYSDGGLSVSAGASAEGKADESD